MRGGPPHRFGSQTEAIPPETLVCQQQCPASGVSRWRLVYTAAQAWSGTSTTGQPLPLYSEHYKVQAALRHPPLHPLVWTD